MNPVSTIRFTPSTWLGLVLLTFGLVIFGIGGFAGAMLLCHPSDTEACKCPEPYTPPIRLPENRRIGDAKGESIEAPPVNLGALNEIKTQSGCVNCPPIVRRPTYVQPTYVQPAPIQPPTYVQPLPVQPATQPTYPKPATVNAPAAPKSSKYQLALFLDGSERSKVLQQWFDTDPYLKQLRGNCAFEVYSPNNALYKARYADIVPVEQFPVVLFQYSDGGHIHAAGLNTIPRTAKELYADLKLGWQNAESVRKAALVAESGTAGALKSRGYNFDTQPNIASQDCPDGRCPVEPEFEDEDRWRLGDRVRDLFNQKDSRELVVWGGAFEIVVYVVVGLFVLAFAITFVLVALFVFIKFAGNNNG